MDSFKRLHEYLHRCGNTWYTWISDFKITTWAKINEDIPIPTGRVNVYFGVHPTSAIPERKDESGKLKPPSSVRAAIPDVSAISCIFSEFDAKRFSSRDETLRQIRSIPVRPSVVNFSGGGYHCYWLLKEPYLIYDNASLSRAKTLQYDWVTYTRGDNGAKDLARVLRVPGTTNYKPEYAPNFPLAKMIFADWTRVYSIDYLESFLPKPELPKDRTLPTKFGKGYLEAALKNEADRVLRARDGERNDTLNKSAFSLGKLAGSGLSQSRIEGTLLCAAIAVGLPAKEAERTIQSGLKGATKAN